MERCHDIAQAHSLSEVWCHAQISALPFYRKIGYSVAGEKFEEAGIDHLKMTRRL
jgi:predicted GNAT family N-acyltransferase